MIAGAFCENEPTQKMKDQAKKIRPIRRGMMGFPGLAVSDPQAAWNEALREEVNPAAKRTMYLHIPYCRTRCSFCPFYMGAADENEFDRYVASLVRELETSAGLPGICGEKINAVYFGGGTPTDMTPEHFARVLQVIHEKYNLTNDCEITVEGRIKGFTSDKMQACMDSGVNRFSLGIQTFNTQIRHRIGRSADREEVIETLNRLIAFNQAAVVVDLLYGLPGQTIDDWVDDQQTILEEVKISGCDHYALGLHSGLPMSQAIAEGRMPDRPDEATRFRMYQLGEDIMRDAGAARLSLKHYAFDYRERNANNEISGEKNICLPFGVHAGGRLGQYFFHQTNDVAEYHQMVSQGIKPFEKARKMPEDFRVCSVIAGQIARRRGFNLETAAAAAPQYRDRILEKCRPLLDNWIEKGLISAGWHDWYRLSSWALFKHKTLIPDLMETIASTWPENSVPPTERNDYE